MEVWSGHAQLLRTIHLIRIYYMILLHKNKCFIYGYDVLRALQEQLSTHKKQEQRNGYQTDQLTFRDAHHYSNNLFKLASIAILFLHLEMLNTRAWIHLYNI